MGKLTDASGSKWVHNTISWFHVKSKKLSKSKKKHPATYPREVPMRFIEILTKKGDWVLDPFVGTGSTCLASRNLYRNSVGIELSPEFSEYAKFRLNEDTLVDDGQHIILNGNSVFIDRVLESHFDEVPQFQLVVTSPPYWDMLKKSRGGSDSRHKKRKKEGEKLTYSNLEDDLGNIENYNNFISSLSHIFVKLKPFLTSNAHIVLILQNIRNDDGIYYPLAWDVAYKLRKKGFELLQEQIWCQLDKKSGIWGYPSTYITNTHHHYCLVLRNSN